MVFRHCKDIYLSVIKQFLSNIFHPLILILIIISENTRKKGLICVHVNILIQLQILISITYTFQIFHEGLLSDDDCAATIIWVKR